MKRIIITVVLLVNYVLAQTKPGDIVQNIKFDKLLNAPVKQVELKEIKKPVLIEYWATWCGPCVDAMSHLQDLQNKYHGKLQIITVTDETEKRIKQFLKSKPSDLWFAIDENRSINELFPHRVIPHSVLLTVDHKVAAITDPDHITAKIIDSVINNKTIHLPQKQEILLSTDDFLKTYFFASDTTMNRLTIQPEWKGGPHMSRSYGNTPAFSGRRITCINLSPVALYMIAYNHFPYTRLIDSVHNDQKLYCIDLIVPDKNKLLPTMQAELLKRFDVQAKIVSHTKDVYILKIADAEKVKNIPLNKTSIKSYGADRANIDGQNISFVDFAQYLEDFCMHGLPVVDETHIADKFDIKFAFQPENPQSLKKILGDMGLSLEKEKRDIDMLMLYKD